MKKYLFFDRDGAVVQTVTCSKRDAGILAFMLGLHYVEDTAEVGDKCVSLEGGAAVVSLVGAPPTKYHAWEATSREWVISRDAFEAAKDDLKAAIDAERDRQRYSGVTYNGVRFDSDPVSAGNLTGWTTAVTAGIPVPDGFTWRSQDNRDIPFTSADILGLAAASVAKTTACYQRAWQLKAQVDAFIDPADYQQLQELNIAENWPE